MAVARRRGGSGSSNSSTEIADSTYRRKRGGYVADPEWQANVIAYLAAHSITEKDFAKKVPCAQSTLHDILHVPYKSSHYIPKINKLLKWEAPAKSLPRGEVVILPTPDAIEMSKLFDQMPDELRKAKLDEFRATVSFLKKSND